MALCWWLCSALQAASSLCSLAPASSNSTFTPALAAQQAANLSSKALKTSIPELNTDWGSTCAELARNAATGTQWPQQSKEVLQRVSDLLGGRWLLVESGLFSTPEHPRVGQPARALVHVATCYVVEQQQGKAGIDGFQSSSSGSKGKRIKGKRTDVPVIHSMKEPTKLAELPAGSKPMWLLATYELNDNGWPTGKISSRACSTSHNSAQAHCITHMRVARPCSCLVIQRCFIPDEAHGRCAVRPRSSVCPAQRRRCVKFSALKLCCPT